MYLIPWDDSIILHITEIDRQHKRLVDIINEMFNAMKDAKGAAVMDDILKRLADFTVYHFATEEGYFDKFHYPESKQHKEEHRDFVKQVNELRKAFDEGKQKLDRSDSSLTVDLWKLLKSWLVNHIQVSDRRYAPLFKQNGVH